MGELSGIPELTDAAMKSTQGLVFEKYADIMTKINGWLPRLTTYMTALQVAIANRDRTAIDTTLDKVDPAVNYTVPTMPTFNDLAFTRPSSPGQAYHS